MGPDVVCITLFAPVADWLDASGASLKPEQILNRALRPLLAMLREDGVDAFYPGRDLVTAGGRTLAHASFTVMRDGVTAVEMHVAEGPAFRDLARLLALHDPSGVAAADREALANATSLGEVGVPARTDDEWGKRFAEAAATGFSCEAAVATDELREVTPADDAAVRSFLATPGPLADGKRSAAAVSMLGAVECAGSLRGDRLVGLEITGDVIAPFHTLDEIACECDGEPLRPAQIRKALARALAKPRSFLLGIRELDELILRLA